MGTIEEFQQLIGTLMSPDNASRSQAEAAYNATKESHPAVVLDFLAQTLRLCPQEQLRAFAAVLFRKACPDLWRKPGVDAGTQTTVKQLLLQSVQEVNSLSYHTQSVSCPPIFLTLLHSLHL